MPIFFTNKWYECMLDVGSLLFKKMENWENKNLAVANEALPLSLL